MVHAFAGSVPAAVDAEQGRRPQRQTRRTRREHTQRRQDYR